MRVSLVSVGFTDVGTEVPVTCHYSKSKMVAEAGTKKDNKTMCYVGVANKTEGGRLTVEPDVGGGVLTVPDGLKLRAMYPYSPVAPHKSSGYPGHWELQSLVLVVSSGAKLEHQQSANCKMAKA